MRPGAFILFGVSAALLLVAAGAALACDPGSTLTVTGTITGVSQFEDEWELEVDIVRIKNCNIWHVRGPGRVPADCAADREFTATGKVDIGGFSDFLAAMAGKNVMGLAASKIECP